MGAENADSKGPVVPPDGWYPDPTGRYDYRYWHDGVWTEHVSRNGVAMVDDRPITGSPDTAETTGADQDRSTRDASESDKEPAKVGGLARWRADRREKAEHRDEFEALALRAAHGEDAALRQLPAAVQEAHGLWHGGRWDSKIWEVLMAAARDVIRDDVVTDAEDAQLRQLATALGTSLDLLQQKDFELFEELVIAGINDGRFPVLSDPPVILKHGESAYASFGVMLMKEVAVREFRAGTSSISIPIAHGVRYRVGGVRGRSVVVGMELASQDSGALVVTSARTLFAGQRKTLEFRHDRLVGLQQYTDGLRLNVSNRQTASLFKFAVGESPSIAAALISAAASHQ